MKVVISVPDVVSIFKKRKKNDQDEMIPSILEPDGSSKVKVVAGDQLPLHRLEILKELVRKASCRKLGNIRNSVGVAA